MKDNLGMTGVIGRFKPLHYGAYYMLNNLIQKSDDVKIGIGSSNKYNIRNPFTPEETRDMIKLALRPFSNFEIVEIPDYGHIPGNEDGQTWKENLITLIGDLNFFITSNGYVKNLLDDTYKVIHPVEIIPENERVRLRGTKVRYELAIEGNWQKYIPQIVVDYIETKKLDERFRNEFGLETIAQLADYELDRTENIMEEQLHTREV